MIAGIRIPDHSTIAEFRRRHETDIAELFDDVLGWCREGGVGVGRGGHDRWHEDQGQRVDGSEPLLLVTEILREAEETDRQEHELDGDRRGDEPPEPLRIPEGRRQAFREEVSHARKVYGRHVRSAY